MPNFLYTVKFSKSPDHFFTLLTNRLASYYILPDVDIKLLFNIHTNQELNTALLKTKTWIFYRLSTHEKTTIDKELKRAKQRIVGTYNYYMTTTRDSVAVQAELAAIKRGDIILKYDPYFK